MKYALFTILLSMFTFYSTDAQKFGYVNTQELLSNMTEMKLADNQIQAFQNDLVSKGEQMVMRRFDATQLGAFESTYDVTREDIAAQARGEFLKAFPLKSLPRLELDVKAEIEKMGKEGGYTIIFDSAPGMILHAADSENLMTVLKSKLGIP